MVTAFKPGSHTAEMLSEARKVKGDAFADMMMATVNTKLQILQMQKDEADPAAIDALAAEATVDLKAYLDANPGDKQFMLTGSDVLIQIARLEESAPESFDEITIAKGDENAQPQ